MKYILRRLVYNGKGFYSGGSSESSESLNDLRQQIPSDWELVPLDDKTKYPEEITIEDNTEPLYNSSNGKSLTGFYERYKRKTV